MLSATEARNAVLTIETGKHKKQLAEIEGLIDKAVVNGEFCVRYYGNLLTSVQSELENLGYTLQYYPGPSWRNEENPTTISW